MATSSLREVVMLVGRFPFAGLVLIAVWLAGAATAEAADTTLAEGLGGSLPWYDAVRDQRRPARVALDPDEIERALVHRDSAWSSTTVPSVTPPRRSTWPDSLNLLRWLGWGMLILVLSVAAWFLIWAYWQSELVPPPESASETQAVRGEAERREHLPARSMLTEVDLCREAESRRRQGDLRMAIVYLYSHLLLALDQAGVVHLSRGKTNLDYLREAGLDEHAGQVLSCLVPVFELVFFGARSPSERQVEECFAAVRQWSHRPSAEEATA